MKKKKLLLAAAVPVLGGLLWMGPTANAACGSGTQNRHDNPATPQEEGKEDDVAKAGDSQIYMSQGALGGNNGYVGTESNSGQFAGSYAELDGESGYVVDSGNPAGQGASVSDTGTPCQAVTP